MSISILYHGFGIIGYHYVRTTYEEGKMIFSIKHKRDKLHCPVCKGKDIMSKGSVPGRFRTMPIGTKQIYLGLPVQRVFCRKYNIIR